jgi:hypothetical protein
MIRELANEEEYHIRGFEDQYEKLGRKRLTGIPFMWLRGILHEDIGVFGLDNAGSCTIGAALRGCSENKGISDSGAEVGFSYDLMGLSIVAKLTDLNKVILFPLVTVHQGKCKQQKGGTSQHMVFNFRPRGPLQTVSTHNASRRERD